jgi:hypothetical protein
MNQKAASSGNFATVPKMPAFEWVHVQLHQQGDDKFITTDYLQQCPRK